MRSVWETYIFDDLCCSGFYLFRIAHIALVVGDTFLLSLVLIHLLDV
jgi:hypothetical protein